MQRSPLDARRSLSCTSKLAPSQTPRLNTAHFSTQTAADAFVSQQCEACASARTRAALGLAEQLAAPSNFHERDGETPKGSVDTGMQEAKRRRREFSIRSKPPLFGCRRCFGFLQSAAAARY